jgi:TPR repeat protein
MNSLANCYATGKGVTINRERAIKWWTKATRKHHGDSYYDLCRWYYEVDNKNTAESVKWCKAGVAVGNARCQYMMGVVRHHTEDILIRPLLWL